MPPDEQTPRRLTVQETLEENGLTMDDLDVLDDSVVPACCEDGCEVEPDGRCPHGHPSILLAMGVI